MNAVQYDCYAKMHCVTLECYITKAVEIVMLVHKTLAQ
jgi:hypothetical protein